MLTHQSQKVDLRSLSRFRPLNISVVYAVEVSPRPGLPQSVFTPLEVLRWRDQSHQTVRRWRTVDIDWLWVQ